MRNRDIGVVYAFEYTDEREYEAVCSITPGSPGTRPSLNDPGSEAEPAELEISEIWDMAAPASRLDAARAEPIMEWLAENHYDEIIEKAESDARDCGPDDSPDDTDWSKGPPCPI